MYKCVLNSFVKVHWCLSSVVNTTPLYLGGVFSWTHCIIIFIITCTNCCTYRSLNIMPIFVIEFLCVLLVLKYETRHRTSTSTHWHFALEPCCHSNETRATIANPHNGAQLGGTPTIPPSYMRVRAIVWACDEGETHRQTGTQALVTTIHFASSATHAKCNKPTA